jgi:hypothetical protein
MTAVDGCFHRRAPGLRGGSRCGCCLRPLPDPPAQKTARYALPSRSTPGRSAVVAVATASTGATAGVVRVMAMRSLRVRVADAELLRVGHGVKHGRDGGAEAALCNSTLQWRQQPRTCSYGRTRMVGSSCPSIWKAGRVGAVRIRMERRQRTRLQQHRITIGAAVAARWRAAAWQPWIGSSLLRRAADNRSSSLRGPSTGNYRCRHRRRRCSRR